MAAKKQNKLLDQLSHALASVDARLIVTTRKQLPAKLDEVLDQLKVKTVAVTNSATLIDTGIIDHLKEKESLSVIYPPKGEQDPSIYREWRSRVAEADAGVTTASMIAAETGTMLLTPQRPDQRAVSLLPVHHIAIFPVTRVVPDIGSLFSLWMEVGLQGNAVMVTGPSRTADIEKELVLGVHGPQTVTVLLYS